MDCGRGGLDSSGAHSRRALTHFIGYGFPCYGQIMNSMKRLCLAVTLAFLGAASAHAQDFVMNSAETIDKGNFKVAGFPILVFGKDGADSEFGFGARAGYGFGSRFDVELLGSVFDGTKLFGADAEYWIVKNGGVDVSAALGIHKTKFDGGFNSTGIDVVGTASGHAGPKFEPYAALKLSFESPSDNADNYTLAHLVPGFEYRLAKDLDLVAELGLALNDHSSSYVSAGLALYIR